MFLILQGRAQKIFKIRRDCSRSRLQKKLLLYRNSSTKKNHLGCLGAIIVIGVAVLCYHKFYAPPKKAEAAVRFLRR